jgi:NAD(P)-dependent dehydrogenase (short-subunit alcohol dehydrogenase family)
MQDKIVKKIALITGSGTRIGKEIALFLSKNNWQIVIHYNNSAIAAHELCKSINQANGKSICVHSDFNNLTNGDEIFAEINKKMGLVSLLINNAAAFENDNFFEISNLSLNKHMQINCIAPILLAKSFVKQNPYEKLNIINLLDCSTTKIKEDFFSYGLSKMTLLNATKKMSVLLAPRCRVNAISPGYVLKNDKQSEEHFTKMVQNTPLKMTNNVEQICNSIEFIIKTDSMTGNNIIIDSGDHLT